MSDIADRLEASLQHGAINGNSFERGIVGEQINEAILEIRLLRKDTQKLMEAAKVERAMKRCFLTSKTIAAMIEAWNHCGNDIRKDLMDQAESELRAEGVIE